MRRSFVKSVLLGAVAFVAAHAIEVTAQIGGDQPWFIATLPSALFTASLMFAAGLFMGTTTAATFPDLYLHVLCLVAGASVPMAVTLFTHPSGPGNLFPIALLFGVVVLGIGSFAGATIGWLLRRARR